MMIASEQVKVGFLGFGKMARSIAEGLKKESRWLTGAFDVIPFASEKTKAFASPGELEDWADLILLCVKPQDMAAAVRSLRGIRPCLSIAAGLSLDRIRSFFTGKAPLLSRCMPNLGATVGLSTTAIYCEDEALRELSIELFRTVGYAFTVSKEDLMHGVTALSGSGPAYVFLMMQAMTEAGVREGIPFDDAMRMTVQTVLASATLLAGSSDHPAEWIRRVSSPAGTTIEGLAALEKNGLRHAIYEAVHRAAQRSRELAKETIPDPRSES
jgi:pyrroline-5-carboxylate reductase